VKIQNEFERESCYKMVVQLSFIFTLRPNNTYKHTTKYVKSYEGLKHTNKSKSATK